MDRNFENARKLIEEARGKITKKVEAAEQIIWPEDRKSTIHIMGNSNGRIRQEDVIERQLRGLDD